LFVASKALEGVDALVVFTGLTWGFPRSLGAYSGLTKGGWVAVVGRFRGDFGST